jgi:molybdopterin synthase sulfur carrier subunit
MAALTILYFARVAEAMGRSSEALDRPHGVKTLGDLADWIEKNGGNLGDRAKLRGAIDQRMATLDTALGDAHEVAFFPPVTGG